MPASQAPETPTHSDRGLGRRDFLKLVGAAWGAWVLGGASPSIGRAYGPRLGATHVPDDPDVAPAVLSETQQRRLHAAAQAYIAGPERADEVARSLDFIGRSDYENASNMCGPLAIAILQDAGLLDDAVDRSRFWLLNLETDVELLERTFPRATNLWYDTTTSVNRFDFDAFPLMAGDLLYIRGGIGGQFDHVAVVTRVDEGGRAYSVTNVSLEVGYAVEEVMLYDPVRPGTGFFFERTDPANRRLRLTGFGGFRLWRLKSGRLAPGEAKSARKAGGPAVTRDLQAYLDSSGGRWNVIVRETGGESILTLRPDEFVHPASTVKIAIALNFFAWAEAQHGDGLEAFLATGTSGRSFNQLLRAMLVRSEEAAAETLVDYLNSRQGHRVEATLRAWGARDTRVRPRESTARDMALLLDGLYSGKFISAISREKILNWIAENRSTNDTRLGVMRPDLPEGGVLYNMRGTITSSRLLVADVGLLELPDPGAQSGHRAYTMVFYGREGNDSTQAQLVEAIEACAHRLLKYARTGA